MTRPLVLLSLLIAIGISQGCASPSGSHSAYPVTQMLDPVTEETPNVIISR